MPDKTYKTKEKEPTVVNEPVVSYQTAGAETKKFDAWKKNYLASRVK
jgi:hypothetical protein